MRSRSCPPIATAFALTPLPPGVLAALILVTSSYVVTAELTKRVFYRSVAAAHAKAAAERPPVAATAQQRRLQHLAHAHGHRHRARDRRW